MPETFESQSTKSQLNAINAALVAGDTQSVQGMILQLAPCDIALMLESSH